jgi:thiol-disulfide isomerase/thioredoxin
VGLWISRQRKAEQILTSLSRILALCCALWLCLGPSVSGQPPGSWPSWSAPTSEGKEFHSRSLEGKVVVVSVWASWCSSCRKQIPILSALQRSYEASELQVVSFSLDHTEEKHNQFLDDLDVSFPAIFARSGRGLTAVKLLQDQAGALEAVPTLLVFDKKGNLAHRSVGFSNLSKLEDLVQPLLGSPSADSR